MKEFTTNLGLPVSPLVKDPELWKEFNSAYTAIRQLATRTDTLQSYESTALPDPTALADGTVALLSDLGVAGTQIVVRGGHWYPVNPYILLAALTEPFVNTGLIGYALDTVVPANMLSGGDVIELPFHATHSAAAMVNYGMRFESLVMSSIGLAGSNYVRTTLGVTVANSSFQYGMNDGTYKIGTATPVTHSADLADPVHVSLGVSTTIIPSVQVLSAQIWLRKASYFI